MLGFASQWNQNAPGCVTLPDTFCKETASCLINIAHPSVTFPSPNPAISALSSAGLLSRWLCCCGLFSATARQNLRLTAARPILSPWKRRRLLIQWLQLRLTPLHQPRLILSPRPLPIRSRLRLLTLSRLRPLTRHLPHHQQPLPTRNFAGLRAIADHLILGGHRAVSALFSFAQSTAPKLPTGMTLC